MSIETILAWMANIEGSLSLLGLTNKLGRTILSLSCKHNVEFFPNRESLERIRPIRQRLAAGDEIYAQWVTGRGFFDEIDTERLKAIKKLILPHPDKSNIEEFQSSIEIKKNYNLRDEIRGTSETAQNLGIEVKWYQQITGVSFTFGNPELNSGWVHMEICLPFVEPGKRQVFRIERKKQEDVFVELWRTYGKIWDGSESP